MKNMKHMKKNLQKIIAKTLVSALLIGCLVPGTVYAAPGGDGNDTQQEYELMTIDETQSESETEMRAEAETQPEAAMQIESESSPEIKPEVQPESEIVPETEEKETKEKENEAESETEAESESETESKTETEEKETEVKVIYAPDIDLFVQELGDLLAEEEDKVELFDANACTNRLLVGYYNQADFTHFEGLSTVLDDCQGSVILQFDSTETANAALTELLQDSNIIYAEFDVLQQVVDEDYSGLSYAAGISTWNTDLIGATSYSEYAKSKSTKTIKVAVVDTGVNQNHPLLSSRVISGYDLVDKDSNPADKNGHGSHVAGVVVACTKMNSNVKILPVRVLDAKGSGYSSAIASGVRYAASHGASVINMSLSGEHSGYEESAITYALNYDCVVVVSAGNDSRYVDSKVCPAHISSCITVGAIDRYKNHASFSNYGSAVDICAPGVDIVSSTLGSNYESYNGTSQAAPHVAGCAALLRLTHPSYDRTWIEMLMKKYVTDLGSSGKDSYYGYGMINLKKILANEHELKKVSAKSATCTENGRKVHFKCIDCGKLFKDKYALNATTSAAVTISKLGHSYGNKSLKVRASTTRDGYYLSTCTRSGCSTSKKETIKRIASISVKSSAYAYTGSAIAAKLNVKDSAGKIIDPKYYTLTYSNNVNPGKATVEVVFKSKYEGSKSLSFIVLPKPTTFNYIKNSTSSAKIMWKRCATSCSGYSIQYSTDPTFKLNSQTKILSGRDTVSCIVSVDTSKTMYYRIRSYKTINGKKYYSKWSGIYQK